MMTYSEKGQLAKQKNSLPDQTDSTQRIGNERGCGTLNGSNGKSELFAARSTTQNDRHIYIRLPSSPSSHGHPPLQALT